MSQQQTIAQVMAEKGVRLEEVPEELHVDPRDMEAVRRSKRYHKVKGFARFSAHPPCSRSWASAHAWSVIDLRQQRFREVFPQSCQQCENSVVPDFPDSSVQTMAEYAVDNFLRKVGRLAPLQRDPFSFDDFDRFFEEDYKGPHDEGRCDMCKRLGRSCWK